MKLFKSSKAILSEISAMENSEDARRVDRSTVSSFYSGCPPLTDADAEAYGLSLNINHLLGYTQMASSAGQLFGLYTRPTRFYGVSIDACPPSDRLKWEMEVSTTFNEAVKSSRRFKPAYQGICGDATMHGEAVMFFSSCTDWAPSQAALSSILVPDDAPADATRQTHWCIEGDLSLSDLHKYVEGNLPGWKVANIRKVLAEIYKDEFSKCDMQMDTLNVEKLEEERQINASSTTRRCPGIKVYYFYQVRADLRGSPVDLTILIHRTESMPQGMDDDDKVLFETEGYYDSATEVLHPFFQDCMVGGTLKWHRVLGQGHLSYDLNRAVELLMCIGLKGTMEASMNLWQAKDSAQREELEQLVIRHNGIVPEGIQLLDKRFVPPQGDTMQWMEYMRQQVAKNSRGATPSSSSVKPLEQQFLAEKTQADEQEAGRVSNWYDDLDRLGETMFSRFTNPFIRPWDAGYSDICKFQGRMQRLGIPLYYLQPHNVKVSVVRLIGDGDTQKAQVGAQWLMQNRASFPPNAQQEITRVAAAQFVGYEMAERLAPETDKPDTSQTLRALLENTVCRDEMKPPTVNDDDVDDTHVPVHLDGMVALIQRGTQFNNATFTPQDHAGFQNLGAHVVMHIHKVESMAGTGAKDGNKAKSKAWMQALNEIVSVGEQLAHNLQQTQQGAEQPDQETVAKLQLQVESLKLQQQKFAFSRDKWERQQLHRENSSAFQQVMADSADKRETQLARAKMAKNDVETALAIKDRQQPKPASA